MSQRQSIPKTGYLVKASYWSLDNKLLTTFFLKPEAGTFYTKISMARKAAGIAEDRFDKSEMKYDHHWGNVTATYTIIKGDITWSNAE